MSQCEVGVATGFLAHCSQVCGRVGAHPSSQRSYHTSSESELCCGVIDPWHTGLFCKWQAICKAETLPHQESFCPSWANAFRCHMKAVPPGGILQSYFSASRSPCRLELRKSAGLTLWGLTLGWAEFAIASLSFEVWLIEEIELSYITDSVSWLITVM